MLILEIKNRKIICDDFTYGLMMEKNIFMGYYKIIPFVGVEVFTNCRICYNIVKELLSKNHKNYEFKLSNFLSVDEKYNNFKNITSESRNDVIGSHHDDANKFSYTLRTLHNLEKSELEENKEILDKILEMLNIDNGLKERIIHEFLTHKRIDSILNNILTKSSNGDLKYADYPIKKYIEDYDEIEDFDYQVSKMISKYFQNNEYTTTLELTNVDGNTHIVLVHKDAIIDSTNGSYKIIFRDDVKKFNNIIRMEISNFEYWLEDIKNRRKEIAELKKEIFY